MVEKRYVLGVERTLKKKSGGGQKRVAKGENGLRLG